MQKYIYQCRNRPIEQCCNEDRLGGFLLPFITGAVISAPFWYIAGNNKYQNQYYPPYPYYQYPPYPYYR